MCVLIFGFYLNRRLAWRFKRWRPPWKASYHARARWSTWSVLWSRRRPLIRKPSSGCGATYPQKPWLKWRWHNSSPAPTEKLKRPIKSLELASRHNQLTDVSYGGRLERLSTGLTLHYMQITQNVTHQDFQSTEHLPCFPKCFTPNCLIQLFHVRRKSED